VQIVHVTDIHFGCEDRAAIGAVERFVRDTLPDAVVASGDLTAVGAPEEMAAAFTWLRGLGVPVFATPGNHDVPYYSLLGRLFDPFGGYRRAASGVHADVWALDACTITAINTARGVQPRMNWAQGAVAPRQLNEAARALRTRGPGALGIVVTHHPLDWPNDAPIPGITRRGLPAQAALIEAGAQLFLSGHLHVASARPIGEGAAVAVCGGTLSQRLRHEPCGFNVIRWTSPSAVEVEIKQITQGVVETAALRRFELAAAPQADAKDPAPAV